MFENQFSNSNPYLLWSGAINNNYEPINLALESGAHPDLMDKVGCTALILAVYNRNFQICKLLKDHGASFPFPADPYEVDRHYKLTPDTYTYRGAIERKPFDALGIAIDNDDKQIFDLLLSLPGAKEHLNSDQPRFPAWTSSVNKASDGNAYYLKKISGYSAVHRLDLGDEDSVLIEASISSLIDCLQIKKHKLSNVPIHFDKRINDEIESFEIKSYTFNSQDLTISDSVLAKSNETVEMYAPDGYYDFTRLKNVLHSIRIDENTYIELTNVIDSYADMRNCHGVAFTSDNVMLLDKFVSSRPPLQCVHDLYKSIILDDVKLFTKSVSQGADLEIFRPIRMDIFCARAGAVEIFKHLTNNDPNFRRNVFYAAPSNGENPVIHELIERSVMSPAATYGLSDDRIDRLFKISSFLTELGIGRTELNADGDTPLQNCATTGNARIAKLLVDAGADYRDVLDNGRPISANVREVLLAKKAVDSIPFRQQIGRKMTPR